ncbi:MAG: CDP-alcohol phosphatidyltransferase family protein [Chromatiales bacterium]|nr:CDP-alcohol phosphatidyltransferase family protein [Chromatiales bacterium]
MPPFHWHRWVPSSVSLLGLTAVLLLCFEPLRPLLAWATLFQLLMDDVDGWLARRLNVASAMGRCMDDICDVVAHAGVVLLIASELGTPVLIAAMINVLGMVTRTARRLSATDRLGWGQTTNDSVVVSLLAWLAHTSGSPINETMLAVILASHMVAMVMPFRVATPRALLSRPIPILGYNALLLAICILPSTSFAAFVLLATWIALALPIGGLKWSAQRRHPA